jgi:hypothetical protein
LKQGDDVPGGIGKAFTREDMERIFFVGLAIPGRLLGTACAPRGDGGRTMALVLIVEDEVQVRVLAESILQGGGYTTLSAGTIEQAIALLDAGNKPELLFTDIGLHGDLQAGSNWHRKS